MIVSLNGTREELPDGARIPDAVAVVRRDPTRRGIAVAVNGAVVPQGAWDDTVLNDGDRIEVLAAVAGG